MKAKYRQVMARLLIGALLFAQGAVAAYACPGLTSAIASSFVDPPAAENMPTDCDQMDTMTPNLCTAHCQFGLQNVDQQQAPSAPPVMFSILYVEIPDSTAVSSFGRISASERTTVADSPPHTILHCCFRI